VNQDLLYRIALSRKIEEDCDLKVEILDGRRFEKSPEGICILVDVFRSTSSIPILLSNGAEYVIPTRTVKEARELRKKIPGALLIGERYGYKIVKFDYGNTPSLLWKTDFENKIIIFTSTNGTKVLNKISGANAVYLSSFINHAATCNKVKGAERVQIYVSGRPDGRAEEDEIYAEFLAADLKGEGPDPHKTIDLVKHCSGARRLSLMGFKEDIEASLRFNSVDFAVRYLNGKIVRDT
jgi:2-phosphosulfolactate phosphatase